MKAIGLHYLKAGKSKKKKIVVIAIAVLVIAAACGAGYYLYNPLKVKASEVTVELGQPISTEAKTYLKKNVDKSIIKNTKVTYKAKPVKGQTYDETGEYTVTLKYENKAAEVKVTVTDTTKPKFCATADAGMDTIAGVELNFAELITATDLSDVKVKINSDKVDLNAAGEYKLTAIAKDRYGNKVKKAVKVTVAEKPAGMESGSVAVDSSTGKVTVTPKYSSSSGSARSSKSSGSSSYSGNGGSASGVIDDGRTWQSSGWEQLY